MVYAAKNPNREWFDRFFAKKILEATAYGIETTHTGIKLDQNESHLDWPKSLKQRVTEQLCHCQWNRYTEPYPVRLQRLVSEFAQVDTESVLLCPGSNYHISLLLSLFSRSLKGHMIVARPSFPLYEAHCHYENIPYQTWDLDDNMEYNLELLPKIPAQSVLIFASPNNPVGNILPKETLEFLLKHHPNSYFIADEAYYDFAKESYIDLIERYSNLIVLRTFSKSFGAAGVRLGYTIASPMLIKELRKLTLPFLLNQFTIVAMSEALLDGAFLNGIQQNIDFIIKERDKLYDYLSSAQNEKHFLVYPSQTNFLLIRWFDEIQKKNVHKKLQNKNIYIRDVSRPQLKHALRVTVSSSEENGAMLDILTKTNH